MPDSEEKKPTSEEGSSSVTEESIPSLKQTEPSPETNSVKEKILEEPSEEALLTEEQQSTSSPQKIELKKQAQVTALSAEDTVEAGDPPASPTPVAPVQPVPAMPAHLASVQPKKETPANLPSTSLEVEIDFVLDRKRIPLTNLSLLAVGEVIALSGADFKATLFLQNKALGEGELVMVDQRPSIQITKVFSNS